MNNVIQNKIKNSSKKRKKWKIQRTFETSDFKIKKKKLLFSVLSVSWFKKKKNKVEEKGKLRVKNINNISHKEGNILIVNKGNY